MQAATLTKSIFKMMLLKSKPQDLPFSYALLITLSIVFVLTKTGVYVWFVNIIDKFDPEDVISISYAGAATIAIVWVLVLFATLRSLFAYYHIVERFVQTASAFVGVDCIFNVVFLMWLTGLAMVPQPMGSYSLGSMGLLLGFILIMYWQFMVYIHILLYSMQISILKAGVFALFYMLLQQNISDWLLNVVISVTTLES